MQAVVSTVDSHRYAKCIEVSKRIRWDIDRDVIRGRAFDLTHKFLPDGLSYVDRLAFLSDRERKLMSQVQGRTYANMFGLVERFIGAKMLEVTRCARAWRPDGVRSAGPLHRRGAQAPGAVPPHRGAGRRGHARGLPFPPATQRCRDVRARQVHVGGARPDLPHRAVLAVALSAEHRGRRRPFAAVQGRVLLPLEGRVAARDPRRARMASRGCAADARPTRHRGRRPDRAGCRHRCDVADTGRRRRDVFRGNRRPAVHRRPGGGRCRMSRCAPTAGNTSCRVRASRGSRRSCTSSFLPSRRSGSMWRSRRCSRLEREASVESLFPLPLARRITALVLGLLDRIVALLLHSNESQRKAERHRGRS